MPLNKDLSARPSRALGTSPAALLLAVAATCAVGLLWGLIDRNWVLVATEVPAVIGLVVVWFLARRALAGSRVAVAAIVIGLLCVIEVAVATLVFDARGLTLAIVVATTSGALGIATMVFWLWHPGSATTVSEPGA